MLSTEIPCSELTGNCAVHPRAWHQEVPMRNSFITLGNDNFLPLAAKVNGTETTHMTTGLLSANKSCPTILNHFDQHFKKLGPKIVS